MKPTSPLFKRGLLFFISIALYGVSSHAQSIETVKQALRPFFNSVDTAITESSNNSGTDFHAKASFFNTDGIDLTAHFVNAGELESITAVFPSANEMTLKAFLQHLAGDMDTTLANPLTSALLDKIPIPLVNFIVFPNDKRISFFNTDAENPEVSIVKEGNEYHFTIQYSTPNDFKFVSINSALSVLDDINVMENIQIAITNEGEESNNPLRLEISSRFRATDFLKKALNTKSFPEAQFTGSIDTKFNMAFAADLLLNFDLGNNVTFEGVGVSIAKQAAGIQLMMNGSLVIPVDDTRLRLALGLGLDPVGPALNGTFDLQSVGAENSGIVEWQEPFGIPNFTFKSIGGDIGGNAATLVDNIGLRADMKLGIIPTDTLTDRRVSGKMDTHLDVNLSQSHYKIKIDNLTLISIIEAFTSDGVDIPEEVRQFLMTGINNAEIDLDPSSTSFSIKGDASFFNVVNGKVDIRLSDSGFVFSGDMDPINLALGGIDILGIHAKGNKKKGVHFLMGMEGVPKVDMSGALSLFGSELAGSEMKIDANGIYLKADASLGSFASGSLIIEGRDFLNSQQLKAHLGLNPPDIMGEIKSFVREEGGAVAGEIVDFILPTFRIDTLSFGTMLDKFTVGAQAEVKYTVGLGNSYRTRTLYVDVDVDFNSPEKIPETTAKIIAALGEQILYIFGDLAEIVFEAVLAVAEEAVAVLVAGAEAFAEGVTAAAEAIGHAFETLGQDIVALVTPRDFPDAAYKGPADIIKTGYRHYELQLSVEGSGDRKYYGSMGLSLHQPGHGPGPFKEKKPFQGTIDMITGALLDDLLKEITPQYIPADAYISEGDNLFLIGRDEDKMKTYNKLLPNEQLTISKHFYVKDTKDASLTLNCLIYRYDKTIFDPDDAFLFLPSIIDDMYKNNNKGYWEKNLPYYNIDGGLLRIYPKLIAHPMMTGELLLADIRNQHNDALQEKIRKGGDIKAIGRDAILAAIETHNLEVIAFLNQIEVHPTLGDFETVLQSYYQDDLALLVFNSLKDYSGVTPDHMQQVLAINQPWLGKLLLEKGLQPNNTNLSTAFSKRAYKLAREIMSKGVTPTVSDLNAAVTKGDRLVTEICLLTVEPTSEMLLTAATNKDTEIFKMLFPKVRDKSLLEEIAQVAWENNSLEMLQMVVATGVDSKKLLIQSIAKAKMGAIGVIGTHSKVPIQFNDPEYLYTAVEYSKRGSHAGVAQYLLEKGAKPDTYLDSVTGNSLLHIVSKRRRKNNKENRFQIGLFNGKPLYFPNIFKRPRDYQLMELFLDYGADVNLKNKKGWTPLHYGADRARNKKSYKLVKKMVEEGGANVNACTNKQRTVLKEANGSKTKKYLKSKGARKAGCTSENDD
ncbi:MAG: hypothetical protein R2781_00215 [Flavobacteriaceae bacterium]